MQTIIYIYIYIKVNPSISKKEPDGDSTLHKTCKGAQKDILGQVHGKMLKITLNKINVGGYMHQHIE